MRLHLGLSIPAHEVLVPLLVVLLLVFLAGFVLARLRVKA